MKLQSNLLKKKITKQSRLDNLLKDYHKVVVDKDYNWLNLKSSKMHARN